MLLRFVVRFLSIVCLLVCCFPARASMTVDVTSSTTSWTPVTYGPNHPDPSNDQQTGSSESDIVGDSSHPSAYTTFGDAGTASLTDGTIGFRIRLGADQSPAGFKGALFVGLDANGDGALDLFIGVNNSGSSDTIGIWNPGTGANISPNTTSIVSAPLASYTITALNYNWTAVNSTIDPTVGAAIDINGDGKNDYFLTFSVPLADVITQLDARGITGVNQNSTFSYVIATATQANSLNQDLNGVGGSYDGSATWATLGVLSDPLTAGGNFVVPEPSSALVTAMVVGVAIAHGNRRRRSRQS